MPHSAASGGGVRWGTRSSARVPGKPRRSVSAGVTRGPALAILVAGLAAAPALATPLDEQIAGFKDAQVQHEGAVQNILKTGLAEARAAEAYAAVRPWLAAHPSTNQTLLYQAGQSAQYAGAWPEAVSFYRKLLKNKKVNATLAATAVPATYRLLINQLRDPEAAYLFMREDGDRLRAYGRAKQFDRWFLEQARQRGDLPALAGRLAAIYNTPADNPADYAESMEALLQAIETFQHGSDELSEAMEKLASAAKAPRELKARWNWIKEVVRFSPEAATFIHSRKEIPRALFEKPVQAARALVAVQPYEGSILVARGWVQFNHGDTPTFLRYVHAQNDFKMAPVREALARLSPQQRSALLATRIQGPRNRDIAIGSMFSPAAMRETALKTPGVLNTLQAGDVPLFDEKLTVADARALAPHLTRNPHAQAALVRAFAAAGTNSFKTVVTALMKSERWRFTDAKTAVETVYRAPGIQRDGDYNQLVKQFEQPGPRYEQLKKQVAKEADTPNRTAAFNALQKELLGNPSTPGVLPLWDALFAQAPDPDKVTMLKTLASNLQGDREYLLRRATSKCTFGKSGKLFWQASVYDNHFQYHQADTRKHGAAFIDHVAGLVQQQARAGSLNETIFGLWLHSVNVKEPEATTLIRELVRSPAYAKLDLAYQRAARDARHFGHLAMTASVAASDPHHVSRELLELPDEATPAQVEAALKAVMDRAARAPSPVAVYGLQKVAALPSLNDAMRSLALSLFNELSPVGPYPSRQGYEQLAGRLVNDMQEAEAWGTLVPCAADFWRSADASDDLRHPRVADALLNFAEAAMEAGAASAALSVAQTGLKSGIGGLDPNDRHNPDAAKQRRARANQLAGKAAMAIGMFDIPVDKTDPAYGLYKSSAEFVQGNLDAAWALYEADADRLLAREDDASADVTTLLRKLPVAYGFWLLERNLEEERNERSEALAKELTIWSRQDEGTFSLEQDAELKIALGDLAFRKGKLPTARATYRKVADAREYKGSEVYLRAALGSVTVDRVATDFSSALEELDRLMRLNNPVFRMRVHYARAEVLMDQENYKEAAEAIEAVLRYDPNHADALILRSRVQYEMRRLVEASQVELGVSQAHKVIVPGESIKIDLRDPTLSVSGVGADIEVEIWAKSGDKERVMLHQLGDSKERFRADVPTALGPAMAGDKTLQVLGKDEIRFGYSKRFRDRMDDLPPDPDDVIGVASDADLALSAGAFPPREGERRLDIEELGLSTAQRALGMRSVRPGNPVYLRVIDPDQSTTPDVDEVVVTLRTSSGDEIRRLPLKETGSYSGEFEGMIPTTGAQALAFASESAPGRDPNMAISSRDYPGWLGEIGDKETARTFGVNLNDNVALGTMTVKWGEAGQGLTHFVLQTSMNGQAWTTRARYPDHPEPWDGRPRVCSIPTFRNGLPVSTPKDRELPADWQEKMELGSVRASCNYLAATVPAFSESPFPIVNTGHPGYSGLMQLRLLFYQPTAAIRRFRLAGCPATDDKGNIQTLFLIDGQPADEEAEDPLTIERELAPGLHEIQVWRHAGADQLQKNRPALLCDVDGQQDLVPCPDSMFDPATFPEGLRKLIPEPALITEAIDGSGLDFAFGTNTRARLVRLVIHGFEGVAPAIGKVTLTDRGGQPVLPVEQDFMALRQNTQLEVLPGDTITARYEDPVSATPKRNRHERRLGVAFNTATITASFLNYDTTLEERVLILEAIRRFQYGSDVGIFIDDPDMDSSAEMDTVDFQVTTSAGTTVTLKAYETEPHSALFQGNIYPVAGTPSKPSEIQVPAGGTLTASYRDMENLDPGIPTDRTVTVQHAQYAPPVMEAYSVDSVALPRATAPADTATDRGQPSAASKKRTLGPETFEARRELAYRRVEHAQLTGLELKGVIGADLCFDVVAPHLALAGSSTVTAYVQTEAGRALARERAEGDAPAQPFDLGVPGTLKLTGALRRAETAAPSGYRVGTPPRPPSNQPPLEEGRFSFSVPLLLGDKPSRSFATRAAELLPSSSLPDGLAVQAGDVVHVAYAFEDAQKQIQWKTASFTVGSHDFLDVMNSSYNEPLSSAFVGEKIYVRVLARGLDRGPERDTATVTLSAESGAETLLKLRETEAHTGVFKGVFALSYADEVLPAELPPVELNGFPVRYGDTVTVHYAARGESPVQSLNVNVNKGADGFIEPFSKRFTGDDMAIQTGFTMAECYFELAKKHRKMEQESLARREMKHARKLLAEAIATHRDDELRAHAEYLLGNLAQEYADLAKNEDDRLPMYQDALKRFSRIPTDYPDTEFADKAQFKTGLVYEKMGEVENSVEEYVKLAYKYPDSDLIPSVMSRLGSYFQKVGQTYKAEADLLREEEDDESKGEVLRLDELSYPQFLNAAMVFGKLQERFPDDPLAGLAGLRAAQNYMRAHLYEEAVEGFRKVVDNETYDDRDIRAQALYWSGLSYERWAGTMSEGNWKGRGASIHEAYKIYRRTTFDFPDSKWAKYARGRLSDPVFEDIILREQVERERVLEALKYEQRRR